MHEPTDDEPPDDAAEPGERRPSRRKPLVLLALVVACVLVVYATPLRRYFDLRGDGIQDVRTWVRSFGVWSPLVFFVLNIVGVSIGVPRLAFSFLGGVLFGWVEGALYSQFGTLGGCWLTFVVARSLGREWVRAAVAARFPRGEKLLDVIGRHTFAANVLIRVMPVGNCFAVNLLMSMSSARTVPFLLGTLVGTLPEAAIYALLGSSAGKQSVPRFVIGLALLGVLAVFHMTWGRRWFARLRETRDAAAAPAEPSRTD